MSSSESQSEADERRRTQRVETDRVYRKAMRTTVDEGGFSATGLRAMVDVLKRDTQAGDTSGQFVAMGSQLPERYELGDVLGEGSSGKVYTAHDDRFDRDVALKLLQVEGTEEQQIKKMARFIQEARLNAKLEHPNIMPLYDIEFGQVDNTYFTMRKANGRTLAALIDEARETEVVPAEIEKLTDCIGIVIRLCSALACAHTKGVVHRDVKPENVMIGEFGEAILLDWGTAVTEEDRTQVTNDLIGTPAYMSPEQARREKIDERTDVYTLGALLYELITFHLPTWSTDVDEFWEKKQAGIIDPMPTALLRDFPFPLQAIVRKALMPQPADRYQSVQELSEDLRALLEGDTVTVYRSRWPERLRRWYRSHRVAIWLLTLSNCLAILILFAFAWWYADRSVVWQEMYREHFSTEDTQSISANWQFWQDGRPLPLSQLGQSDNGELMLPSVIDEAIKPQLINQLPVTLPARFSWTVRFPQGDQRVLETQSILANTPAVRVS